MSTIGLAAFSEITSLLLLLIISLHINFAITEIDFIDFLINWVFVIRLPETLTAVGCYAMMIATCIGVFIIADTLTGVIVSIIAGSLVIGATILWVKMIQGNLAMAEASCRRILVSFNEEMKSE